MEHILDNDLYKFTMQMGAAQLFPNAYVRYDFFNRGKTVFPDALGDAVNVGIQGFQDNRLQANAIDFLRRACPFLSPVYLDFLKGYRFDSSEVRISQREGKLKIRIEGPWYRTILWEVPLMALISEEYFRLTHQYAFGTNQWPAVWAAANERNAAKVELIKLYKLLVACFSTRRRYSFQMQDIMLDVLGPYLVGTSNVYQAMIRNMKPIGTHAHEWFQFHAAIYGYRYANRMALANWAEIFRGNLGIALPDTFTTDVFLRDFDMFYAKLFDGVRHDSGDPFQFADKIIKHYQSMGIDPMSKTIVFSDGLTVEKAVEIAQHCDDKIKCSFGIGTHLSNDVDVEPLNMVIKMTGVRGNDGRWINAVKLSDDKGKNTGNRNEIELCKGTLL